MGELALNGIDVIWWNRRNDEAPTKDTFVPVSRQLPYTISKKPRGGLWTSPLVSEYGWWHWAMDEGQPFRLRTKAVSLYRINSIEEAEAFMDRYGLEVCLTEQLSMWDARWTDFAKVYDGLWLTERGQAETRMPYLFERDTLVATTFEESERVSFYGWDCETIFFTRWCFLEIEPLSRNRNPHRRPTERGVRVKRRVRDAP